MHSTNKNLFNTVLSNDTKLVLELGSRLGSSAKFILDTTPNTKKICVDTWSEYGFGTFNKAWRPEYLIDNWSWIIK